MAKSFDVKINFVGLIGDLNLLRESAPEAAKSISIELAQRCAKNGKITNIISKRTGNLRSTSRAIIEGKSVKFVTGGIKGNPSSANAEAVFVDYAFWVNNGTSKQPPQFFMERVLERTVMEKDAFYRKALTSWLDKVK